MLYTTVQCCVFLVWLQIKKYVYTNIILQKVCLTNVDGGHFLFDVKFALPKYDLWLLNVTKWFVLKFRIKNVEI